MSAVSSLPPPSLQTLVERIEAFLSQQLDQQPLPGNLLEAVRYSVLGPGKRLRPILAMLSCEAAGGRDEQALPAAAALELIHAFSLVHDDLPAMDNDELRRGRPTLHIHAGEAMAILAGDAMVALAFGMLSDAPLPPDRKSWLVAELAEGTNRMIAGQVFDTLGGLPGDRPRREQLELIHRHKTGSLIRAACRMGGISAGASTAQLQVLAAFGDAVGLMFQIVDDLLDVTQSAQHLGKAVGKDQSAGKLTFPSVLGLEGSRQEIRRLSEAARRDIEPLGEGARPLIELCEYMAVRTR